MQLPTVGWRSGILAIFAAVLMGHGTAWANPLTFYDVTAIWSDAPGSVATVDLFSNPGAVLAGNVIYVPERNRALAFVGFDVSVTGPFRRQRATH